MDKIKNIALVFVIGAVLGVAGGYFFFRAPVAEKAVFGAISVPSVSTTTHGTALQDSLLYQWQYNVVETLSGNRAPLVGAISYSSSTFTLPTPQGLVAGGGIATTTISSSTGGASALATAVQGDFVLVSVSSSSLVTKGMVVKGEVTSAATVLLTFLGTSSSSMPTGVVGLDLRILPKATFSAPATLKVSTSAAPYNN